MPLPGRRAEATRGDPGAWTLRPARDEPRNEPCGECLRASAWGASAMRGAPSRPRVASRWHQHWITLPARSRCDHAPETLTSNGVAQDCHLERARRQRAASPRVRHHVRRATRCPTTPCRKRRESCAVLPGAMRGGAHWPCVVFRTLGPCLEMPRSADRALRRMLREQARGPCTPDGKACGGHAQARDGIGAAPGRQRAARDGKARSARAPCRCPATPCKQARRDHAQPPDGIGHASGKQRVDRMGHARSGRRPTRSPA
jgi:hypothetical protein